MASAIKIKRSSTTNAPATLNTGELSYSFGAGTASNSGERLFIGGMGSGSNLNSTAGAPIIVGGHYYTSLIDAGTAGTLQTTASSIPILSSTGTIDKWLPGNLQLTGNTISSTNTNGNIALTPNGSGAVQISGAYTLPTTAGTNGYALITNGTSAASWQAISTTLTINGGGASTGTVNLLNQSLTVSGGNGITTSMSGQTLTISSIGAGGYTSTATGGGTTTLTASSTANQFFTGTTTQTVKLPSTATLTVGQEFIITNNSTGNLTIQTSAAGAITTQIAATQITYTVASTGAETWVYETTGFSSNTGTGANVLSNSPTLVTPVLGAATATSIVTSAGLVSSGIFSGTYSDGIILDYDSGNSNARVSAGSGDSITFYNAADATRVQLLKIGSTGHITLEGVTSTGATGTGNFVFSTSPSLTTPTIGSAGANFSGSTSGTITVAAAAVAGSNTLTLPAATDTLVGKATSDTLTNKSISFATNTITTTSAQLATAISDETGTGVVVFNNTPSLTTPAITGGTLSGITQLGVRDTSAAFDVTIGATSSVTLTAGRALTIDVQNAARTIALGGNISLAGTLTTAGAFTTSGAYSVTLTSTNTTNVTLPTTGTLATLAGSETLTNKTLGSGSTWNGNTVGIAYGGTGSTTGSITGSGALSFTAGGSNTNINLVPNGTGTVDVASARITSVATPTQATDAANKAYVDNSAAGLNVKNPVQAATTTALSVTYNNGTSGVGATLTNAGTQTVITIDGQVLEVGDRVLVKDQASSLQNGIYVVSNIGSVSTNWVMTRATDFDGNSNGGKVTANSFTFVEEGTQANNGYTVQIAVDDVIQLVVGTDPIVWVQFSGAGEITAGAGLTKTGNTIDVIGTTNRILANADSIDISPNYVGQTSITTLGTITTGTWNGAVIGAAYGGTGIANNAAYTITLGGAISTAGAFTLSGAYSTTLTLTANTSVTLPTTGTLATLAGSESLSNKTITSSSFSGTTVAASGNVTFTSSTDASALGTAPVVLSGGLSVAKSIYVGTNITGAGAATSTLDGFSIDGGTY